MRENYAVGFLQGFLVTLTFSDVLTDKMAVFWKPPKDDVGMRTSARQFLIMLAMFSLTSCQGEKESVRKKPKRTEASVTKEATALRTPREEPSKEDEEDEEADEAADTTTAGTGTDTDTGVASGGASCNVTGSSVPPNGVWPADVTETKSGEVLTATCNAGYAGSPTMTCSDGVWGTISGECVVQITCDNLSTAHPLTSFPGASWPTNQTVSGVPATGTCPAGYSGSLSVACDQSGNWGFLVGGCTPPTGSLCHDLHIFVNNLPDTFSEYANDDTNWGSQSDAQWGETIHSTCETGFTSTQPPTIICQNGTWGSPIGTPCTPSGCTNLQEKLPANPLITWGTVDGATIDIPTFEASSGQVVAGVCNGTGNPTATCHEGSWNVEPGCTPADQIPCQGLSDYASLTETVSGTSQPTGTWPQEEADWGSSVSATCNMEANYVPLPDQGPPVVTCQTGEWSGPVGACVPGCSAPSGSVAWDQFIDAESWVSNTAPIGSSISGSCQRGYDGSPTATCGSDFRWTITGCACPAAPANSTTLTQEQKDACTAGNQVQSAQKQFGTDPLYTTDLPDGLYHIKTADGKYLNAHFTGDSNSYPYRMVVTRDAQADTTQQWVFTTVANPAHIPEGYIVFTIQNKQAVDGSDTNSYLDAEGSLQDRAVLRDSQGNLSQQWAIKKISLLNHYAIFQALETPPGLSGHPYASNQLSDCWTVHGDYKDYSYAQWKRTGWSDKWWQQRETGKYLESENNSSTRDNVVATRGYQDHNSQKWQYSTVTGEWSFRKEGWNEPNFLDAYDSSTSTHRVVMRGDQANDSQKWDYGSVGKDIWTTIKQKSSGRYLACRDFDTSSVIVKPGESAIWILERVSGQ